MPFLFFSDAAKPEKQTEVPPYDQEIRAEIAKLKEDLDNAREELQKLKNTSDFLRKELREMKNFTPVGIAKHVTTKVCKFRVILLFYLMLHFLHISDGKKKI